MMHSADYPESVPIPRDVLFLIKQLSSLPVTAHELKIKQ